MHVPAAPGADPHLPDRVLEVVRDAVVTVLEVDPADVLPVSDLAADLGADSLAVVEIAEIVEAALRADLGDPGFAFDDEALDGLRTVGDILDLAVARR